MPKIIAASLTFNLWESFKVKENTHVQNVTWNYLTLTLTLIALINIFLSMSIIPKPSEMYLQ